MPWRCEGGGAATVGSGGHEHSIIPAGALSKLRGSVAQGLSPSTMRILQRKQQKQATSSVAAGGSSQLQTCSLLDHKPPPRHPHLMVMDTSPPPVAVAPKEAFVPKSNSKSVMNAPKGGKVFAAPLAAAAPLRILPPSPHASSRHHSRPTCPHCLLLPCRPDAAPAPPLATHPPPTYAAAAAGQGRQARRGEGQEARGQGLWRPQPDEEVIPLLAAAAAGRTVRRRTVRFRAASRAPPPSCPATVFFLCLLPQHH